MTLQIGAPHLQVQSLETITFSPVKVSLNEIKKQRNRLNSEEQMRGKFSPKMLSLKKGLMYTLDQNKSTDTIQYQQQKGGRRSKSEICNFLPIKKSRQSILSVQSQNSSNSKPQKSGSFSQSVNCGNELQQRQKEKNETNIKRALELQSIFKSKIDLSNKYVFKQKFLKKFRAEHFDRQTTKKQREKLESIKKMTNSQEDCKCKVENYKIASMLTKVVHELLEEKIPKLPERKKIKSQNLLRYRNMNKNRYESLNSLDLGNYSLKGICQLSINKQINQLSRRYSKQSLNHHLGRNKMKQYNNEITSKIKEKYNRNKEKYNNEFGNVLDLIKRKTHRKSEKCHASPRRINMIQDKTELSPSALPQLSPLKLKQSPNNLLSSRRRVKSSTEEEINFLIQKQRRDYDQSTRRAVMPKQHRYLTSDNDSLSGIEYCLVSTKRRFLQKTLSSNLKSKKQNSKQINSLENKGIRKKYCSLEFQQSLKILRKSQCKSNSILKKSEPKKLEKKKNQKKKCLLETKHLCSPWDNGSADQIELLNQEII